MVEPHRLQGLQKAFAAREKALKFRLLRLEALKSQRQTEAVELGHALASPLLACLPAWVPSLRRLAQIEAEIVQIGHAISALRRQLIETHGRAELSAGLVRQHMAESARVRDADAMLEMVTDFHRSSLRQDGGD